MGNSGQETGAHAGPAGDDADAGWESRSRSPLWHVLEALVADAARMLRLQQRLGRIAAAAAAAESGAAAGGIDSDAAAAAGPEVLGTVRQLCGNCGGPLLRPTTSSDDSVHCADCQASALVEREVGSAEALEALLTQAHVLLTLLEEHAGLAVHWEPAAAVRLVQLLGPLLPHHPPLAEALLLWATGVVGPAAEVVAAAMHAEQQQQQEELEHRRAGGSTGPQGTPRSGGGQWGPGSAPGQSPGSQPTWGPDRDPRTPHSSLTPSSRGPQFQRRRRHVGPYGQPSSSPSPGPSPSYMSLGRSYSLGGRGSPSPSRSALPCGSTGGATSWALLGSMATAAGGLGAEADTATSGPAAVLQHPNGAPQRDGSDAAAAAVQLDVAAEVLYGIVRHCRRLQPELCARAQDLMAGMLLLWRGTQRMQRGQQGSIIAGVPMGGNPVAGAGAVSWPGSGMLLVEAQGALAGAAEEEEEEAGEGRDGARDAGGEQEASVCVREMWVSGLAAALRDCVGDAGGEDDGGAGGPSLDACVRLVPAPARSHDDGRRGSLRQLQRQQGHTRGRVGGQAGVVLCMEPVAVLTAAVLQAADMFPSPPGEGRVEGQDPDSVDAHVHQDARVAAAAAAARHPEAVQALAEVFVCAVAPPPAALQARAGREPVPHPLPEVGVAGEAAVAAVASGPHGRSSTQTPAQAVHARAGAAAVLQLRMQVVALMAELMLQRPGLGLALLREAAPRRPHRPRPVVNSGLAAPSGTDDGFSACPGYLGAAASALQQIGVAEAQRQVWEAVGVAAAELQGPPRPGGDLLTDRTHQQQEQQQEQQQMDLQGFGSSARGADGAGPSRAAYHQPQQQQAGGGDAGTLEALQGALRDAAVGLLALHSALQGQLDMLAAAAVSRGPTASKQQQHQQQQAVGRDRVEDWARAGPVASGAPAAAAAGQTQPTVAPAPPVAQAPAQSPAAQGCAAGQGGGAGGKKSGAGGFFVMRRNSTAEVGGAGTTQQAAQGQPQLQQHQGGALPAESVEEKQQQGDGGLPLTHVDTWAVPPAVSVLLLQAVCCRLRGLQAGAVEGCGGPGEVLCWRLLEYGLGLLQQGLGLGAAAGRGRRGGDGGAAWEAAARVAAEVVVLCREQQAHSDCEQLPGHVAPGPQQAAAHAHPTTRGSVQPAAAPSAPRLALGSASACAPSGPAPQCGRGNSSAEVASRAPVNSLARRESQLLSTPLLAFATPTGEGGSRTRAKRARTLAPTPAPPPSNPTPHAPTPGPAAPSGAAPPTPTPAGGTSHSGAPTSTGHLPSMSFSDTHPTRHHVPTATGAHATAPPPQGLTSLATASQLAVRAAASRACAAALGVLTHAVRALCTPLTPGTAPDSGCRDGAAAPPAFEIRQGAGVQQQGPMLLPLSAAAELLATSCSVLPPLTHTGASGARRDADADKASGPPQQQQQQSGAPSTDSTAPYDARWLAGAVAAMWPPPARREALLAAVRATDPGASSGTWGAARRTAEQQPLAAAVVTCVVEAAALLQQLQPHGPDAGDMEVVGREVQECLVREAAARLALPLALLRRWREGGAAGAVAVARPGASLDTRKTLWMLCRRLLAGLPLPDYTPSQTQPQQPLTQRRGLEVAATAAAKAPCAAAAAAPLLSLPAAARPAVCRLAALACEWGGVQEALAIAAALLATPTHPALSARAPRESATPGRPQSSAPPPSPSPGHRLATWRCSGLLLRPAPLFPGCHVPPAWLAGWTDPRDGTALLLQLAEAARPLLTAAAAADAGAMAAAARGGGGGTAAGVPDIDRDLPAAAALTLACCSWAAAVLGPALCAAALPPAASVRPSSAPVPPVGGGIAGASVGSSSSRAGAVDGVSLLGEAAKYLVVALRCATSCAGELLRRATTGAPGNGETHQEHKKQHQHHQHHHQHQQGHHQGRPLLAMDKDALCVVVELCRFHQPDVHAVQHQLAAHASLQPRRLSLRRAVAQWESANGRLARRLEQAAAAAMAAASPAPCPGAFGSPVDGQGPGQDRRARSDGEAQDAAAAAAAALQAARSVARGMARAEARVRPPSGVHGLQAQGGPVPWDHGYQPQLSPSAGGITPGAVQSPQPGGRPGQPQGQEQQQQQQEGDMQQQQVAADPEIPSEPLYVLLGHQDSDSDSDSDSDDGRQGDGTAWAGAAVQAAPASQPLHRTAAAAAPGGTGPHALWKALDPGQTVAQPKGGAYAAGQARGHGEHAEHTYTWQQTAGEGGRTGGSKAAAGQGGAAVQPTALQRAAHAHSASPAGPGAVAGPTRALAPEGNPGRPAPVAQAASSKPRRVIRPEPVGPRTSSAAAPAAAEGAMCAPAQGEPGREGQVGCAAGGHVAQAAATTAPAVASRPRRIVPQLVGARPSAAVTAAQEAVLDGGVGLEGQPAPATAPTAAVQGQQRQAGKGVGTAAGSVAAAAARAGLAAAQARAAAQPAGRHPVSVGLAVPGSGAACLPGNPAPTAAAAAGGSVGAGRNAVAGEPVRGGVATGKGRKEQQGSKPAKAASRKRDREGEVDEEEGGQAAAEGGGGAGAGPSRPRGGAGARARAPAAGAAAGGGGQGGSKAAVQHGSKAKKRKKPRTERRRPNNPFLAACYDETMGRDSGTDDDWSDLEDFVVCQPDRDYHQLLRGRFRYAPVDEEEGEGQGEPEGEEGEGDEGKEEMEGEP